MTLLPRLKADFYLVVAGLVCGHPCPVCRCGATAFRHLPLPFLRTKEAALFIGVSCRTLEKHRIYGTDPNYSKISCRVFYAIGDLTEWAKRGAKHSTSDPGKTTVLDAKSDDTVSQMEPIPDAQPASTAMLPESPQYLVRPRPRAKKRHAAHLLTNPPLQILREALTLLICPTHVRIWQAAILRLGNGDRRRGAVAYACEPALRD